MRSRGADAEVTTGSIRPVGPRPQAVASDAPPQLSRPATVPATPEHRDFAAARAAVSEALGKDGRDGSVPWEDPNTGARGTVTPLSSAYTQDGTTCRDFLASYVRDGSESWLQGEACRGLKGRWEVRQMRPWRRT